MDCTLTAPRAQDLRLAIADIEAIALSEDMRGYSFDQYDARDLLTLRGYDTDLIDVAVALWRSGRVAVGAW